MAARAAPARPTLACRPRQPRLFLLRHCRGLLLHRRLLHRSLRLAQPLALQAAQQLLHLLRLVERVVRRVVSTKPLNGALPPSAPQRSARPACAVATGCTCTTSLLQPVASLLLLLRSHRGLEQSLQLPCFPNPPANRCGVTVDNAWLRAASALRLDPTPTTARPRSPPPPHLWRDAVRRVLLRGEGPAHHVRMVGRQGALDLRPHC